MFGITIPPGIDIVRIYALSGKQGKPPSLWEGSPNVDQAAIEASIGRDRRVVHWLRRNHLIQNGVAMLNLQLDCFSQGRRIESFTTSDVTILVAGRKRRQAPAGDEAIVRAFDLCEHMLDSYKDTLEERDTVIGRLVERGLKFTEQPKPVEARAAEPQSKDSLDDILEKGAKFLALAQGFRSIRGPN